MIFSMMKPLFKSVKDILWRSKAAVISEAEDVNIKPVVQRDRKDGGGVETADAKSSATKRVATNAKGAKGTNKGAVVTYKGGPKCTSSSRGAGGAPGGRGSSWRGGSRHQQNNHHREEGEWCHLHWLIDANSYLRRIPSRPVKRAYLIFGVRQGAIIIAINDILWCSFLVFLLALAISNFEEVNTIVDADAQAQARANGEHLQIGHELSMPILTTRPPKGFVKDENGVETLNGRTLPNCCGRKVMTTSIILAIIMTIVDMMSCVMLLFGAIMRVRSLMMPWMSIRLLEIVVLCSTLLVSASFVLEGIGFAKIVFAGIGILLVVFYHWLVVYSLHETLYRNERKEGQLKHSLTVATVPDIKISISDEMEADQRFLFSMFDKANEESSQAEQPNGQKKDSNGAQHKDVEQANVTNHQEGENKDEKQKLEDSERVAEQLEGKKQGDEKNEDEGTEKEKEKEGKEKEKMTPKKKHPGEKVSFDAKDSDSDPTINPALNKY